MGKWGTGKVLRKCRYCGIEFYARHDRLGIYCNRSCSRKDKPQKNFRILKSCTVCAKEFSVKRHRLKTALYCSPSCRRKRMPSGINHPRWNNGISERPHSSRQAIIELRKAIKECQKCNGNYRLQGHHIIPYAERPDLANQKENIVILCIFCHAKEHPKFANLILKGGVYGREMDKKSAT
jgi:hypothetical protein